MGKSEVALLLAQRLNGEIISVDSMQVYRGMDIGTAKSSAADRALIPHHLIDVVVVTEPFDAARFVQLARGAVAQIQSRGKVPIFCGGTGLYFKAYLDGLGETPSGDPALRAELEATPLSQLLEELKQADSLTYESIDRRNPRRVIRAIEVIRLTGKPFSSQRASWTHATPDLPPAPNIIAFSRSLPDLQTRISARVEEMFRRGLVEETRRLLDAGLARNPTAMQALGYRQVVEHLQGERPLSETIELVKLRTRQFAKRQMTWFRGQLRPTWMALGPTQDPESVADSILASFAPLGH